jgi:hypothetical protein
MLIWKLKVILNLYQIQSIGEKLISKHYNFQRQQCPNLSDEIEIEYQSWFISLKIVKDLLKVSF